MAFHGDLFSFPLPELLQWLDSSRKTGVLQLSWEGGERKLYLETGQVVATSSRGLWERLARILNIAGKASGARVMEAFRELATSPNVDLPFATRGILPQDPRGLARDELFGTVVDLTLSEGGRFHWTEDVDRSGEEWVPLELGLRALVFEALRWVDEAAEAERALPSDTLIVRAKVQPGPEHPLLYRTILLLCAEGRSLGQVRLTLGLSRSAGVRRLYDLMRLDMVEVEGVGGLAQDPISQMLEKGLQLVQEQQFDAAGLVFSALLQIDPADRRVREFARMVGAEHLASLYRLLPPLSVWALATEDAQALSSLRSEERRVASLVNGTWDICTIALASPVRELETLKALNKLLRMGLLRPASRS